jgi:hypothetical protein
MHALRAVSFEPGYRQTRVNSEGDENSQAGEPSQTAMNCTEAEAVFRCEFIVLTSGDRTINDRRLPVKGISHESNG